MPTKSLCVFCGSRNGTDDQYKKDAEELGILMAEKSIKLVFGGGKIGLMGAVADSVLYNGGEVVGVIPQSLVNREVAHFNVTDLRVVNSMHERKAIMYELSNGFIVLPGGFGTLDEFCEIFTWFQLGFHRKRIGFLNTQGYFDHLLKHFEYSAKQGFVDNQLLDKVIISETPNEMIKKMEDL